MRIFEDGPGGDFQACPGFDRGDAANSAELFDDASEHVRCYSYGASAGWLGQVEPPESAGDAPSLSPVPIEGSVKSVGWIEPAAVNSVGGVEPGERSCSRQFVWRRAGYSSR